MTCYSACDGSLQFIVDNIQTGTAPYTYSIDGGLSFQNSNTFSSLCGGTNYSIIVKDVNGCTFSSNIFLSEPTEILLMSHLLILMDLESHAMGLMMERLLFSLPLVVHPTMITQLMGEHHIQTL